MATWVQAPHHAPSPIGQSHLLCVQAALDPQLPLVRLQVAPSELIRPPARPATAPLRLPVALEPPELLGHLQGAPARQAFMARSHQSPGRLQVREHLTQSLRMLSNEPQLHYSSQQQKRLLVVAAPQRCRQPYPYGPMDPGFDPSLARQAAPWQLTGPREGLARGTSWLQQALTALVVDRGHVTPLSHTARGPKRAENPGLEPRRHRPPGCPQIILRQVACNADQSAKPRLPWHVHGSRWATGALAARHGMLWPRPLPQTSGRAPLRCSGPSKVDSAACWDRALARSP